MTGSLRDVTPVVPPSAGGVTAPSIPVEELDTVVIRFAGDSGDGMQLVGDEFSKSVALRGSRLRHPPRLSLRDPGARRHPLRGLRLPDPVFLARGVHLGRRPRRAGGDESRGAQDQPRGPQAGRDDHRQRRRLYRGQPGQGRVRGQSAHRRQPVGLSALRHRHQRAHHPGGGGLRALEEGGRPLQELLCAGAHALAVSPPAGGRSRRHPARFSARHPRSPRRTSRRCAPASPTATPASCSPSPTRSGRRRAGPGRYRSVTGNQALALGFAAASELSGAPSLSRLLSDHAGVRHPAGPGRRCGTSTS